MAGGEGSVKKLTIAERRALAISLRKQGGNYREIAETLREQDGVSPKYDQSQAYDDVMFELRRLKELSKADAELVLTLEQERLTSLFFVCYEKAQKGDLYAVDRCLAISDKLVRLAGIEPPQRIAPTNPDGTREYQGSAKVLFYIPSNGRDVPVELEIADFPSAAPDQAAGKDQGEGEGEGER
jgi:hypothetical protein